MAKIIRKSIFTFLQDIHFFTSTPSLLVVPFALSTLVSRSLVTSSSLFPLLHARFSSLLLAAGIPPQSHLFPILALKLSQAILSFVFVFPFAISSLLLSKASIIRALHPHPHKLPYTPLVFRLLITHFCNSFFILSANATCVSLIAILFNSLNLSSPKFLLLLSASGTIFYSIILANAYVVSNLSYIVSGVDNRSGFNSILRACILILQGGSATALSLAVPINLGFAAIEALFETRIVRGYDHYDQYPKFSMALEAMIIVYLYALLLVLDTIVTCLFFKTCKLSQHQIHHRDFYSHNIQIDGGKRVIFLSAL